MIVWITHVKVGHRQTSIPKNPQVKTWGFFTFKAIQFTGFKTQLFAAQMRAVRSRNHAGVELTRWRFGANWG